MRPTVKFTKLQGCGNDYIYVNCFGDRPQSVDDPAALAAKISDRHFGVGGDGLILLMPSDKADVRMRMFNPDGSEAEMCGNGIRCLAKLAYESHVARKQQMTVETGAGVKTLDLLLEDSRVVGVRVNMGKPVTERVGIPMLGPPGSVVDEFLTAGDRDFRVTCVSMGNPHCVSYVEDVDRFNVHEYGPLIEHHEAFPRRTNAEFVQVISPREVRIRTWERGAGETLACGTGASAACVAGVLSGRTNRVIAAHLLGGDLELEWSPDGNVYMTGPAVEVFSGEWPL